jgi:hypothetical protein
MHVHRPWDNWPDALPTLLCLAKDCLQRSSDNWIKQAKNAADSSVGGVVGHTAWCCCEEFCDGFAAIRAAFVERQ